MANYLLLHANIHGQVQGVYFRAFIEEKARESGLKGFVRNLPSGKDLEVEVEGDRDSLGKLLDYLKKGPPAAEVEKITFHWRKPKRRYTEFVIRG